ncbi:hypothetical protein GN956_G1700 [Arapaima gigas]
MADVLDSCGSEREFSTCGHHLVSPQKRDIPGTGGPWEFREGMKRGFSPAGPFQSSPSPEGRPHSGAGHRSGAAEHRPKRERKHKTYTLCEVCNIQLNSAAQAQIHYNGKSHQKRLKQISSGKSPSCAGKGEEMTTCAGRATRRSCHQGD